MSPCQARTLALLLAFVCPHFPNLVLAAMLSPQVLQLCPHQTRHRLHQTAARALSAGAPSGYPELLLPVILALLPLPHASVIAMMMLYIRSDPLSEGLIPFAVGTILPWMSERPPRAPLPLPPHFASSAYSAHSALIGLFAHCTCPRLALPLRSPSNGSALQDLNTLAAPLRGKKHQALFSDAT